MMILPFGPNNIELCKDGNIYIFEQDEGSTIIRKVDIPHSS